MGSCVRLARAVSNVMEIGIQDRVQCTLEHTWAFWGRVWHGEWSGEATLRCWASKTTSYREGEWKDERGSQLE